MSTVVKILCVLLQFEHFDEEGEDYLLAVEVGLAVQEEGNGIF